MKITAIPKEELGAIWPRVHEALAKAVNVIEGKFTVGDVALMIREGLVALWVVHDEDEIVAALTTRIIAYPEGNALALDWVGGSQMAKWLPDALAMMEEYAAEYDCTHLEGYGRKAWMRWIGKYGWREEYIAFRKDLKNG